MANTEVDAAVAIIIKQCEISSTTNPPTVIGSRGGCMVLWDSMIMKTNYGNY
jgi:hypothetical protein